MIWESIALLYETLVRVALTIGAPRRKGCGIRPRSQWQQENQRSVVFRPKQGKAGGNKSARL